jgi:hypothetical protein
MQAKTMIQAIAATLILTAATSWGSMIWNFDDGTAQGWTTYVGGAPTVLPADGGYELLDSVASGNAGFTITGLNETVLGMSDYVKLDTSADGNYVAYRVDLTTAESIGGNYRGSIPGGGGDNLKFDLFSLTLADGASALSVGDHITSISIVAYAVGATGVYADNIILAVPEPATLGLLALSACCLLRRRR